MITDLAIIITQKLNPPSLSHIHAASTAAAADIQMAGLAREFDLSDLGAELQAPAPAVAEPARPAAALDDPLFDLDAMDFGMVDAQRAPAEPLQSAQSVPSAALEDHLFDIPAMPAPASAPFAENDRIAPEFDATTFDFDLPGDNALPLPEVHTLSDAAFDTGAAGDVVDTAVDAPADEGALAPAHMEMETKLDLAIAYQEIGDKEGARELLDEVIKGGTGEQIGRANAMRAALA